METNRSKEVAYMDRVLMNNWGVGWPIPCNKSSCNLYPWNQYLTCNDKLICFFRCLTLEALQHAAVAALQSDSSLSLKTGTISHPARKSCWWELGQMSKTFQILVFPEQLPRADEHHPECWFDGYVPNLIILGTLMVKIKSCLSFSPFQSC